MHGTCDRVRTTLWEQKEQSSRALPPSHTDGFLPQVVTHQQEMGSTGVLFDDILVPSNFDPRALHRTRDLVAALLLVASGVAIHSVDADASLEKPCQPVTCGASLYNTHNEANCAPFLYVSGKPKQKTTKNNSRREFFRRCTKGCLAPCVFACF